MTPNDKFSFWFPLDIIEKGSTETLDPTAGEVSLVLGGIASTIDADSDGESLDPNGFDITPLMTNGVVNWHHQAKGQPKTIIGEPIKGEIRPEGLYLETMLYPSSQIARDVYELAQTLEQDSKTRRLGYSIEGKVLKRKSNNKQSPDYKKILKAAITGVAITHMPKNPKTFANIIKGEIDDDELDMEEAMDTENARATMPESVDGKKPKNLSKAEVLDNIFANIPGITIEKAERIFQLTLKIANMSKRKQVTNEDISKAYGALGLDIEKADKGDSAGDDVEKCDANGGTQVKEHVTLQKGRKKVTNKMLDEAEDDDDEGGDTAAETGDSDNDATGDTDDGTMEAGKKASLKKADDDGDNAIIKAIQESDARNAQMLRAVGVLVKDCRQAISAADARHAADQEIIKGLRDELGTVAERIEQFGAYVPAQKSISAAKPIERSFEKSNQADDLSGEGRSAGLKDNQVSVSNRSAVIEILDRATFNKGFDQEFSKACTDFEQSGMLPAHIAARIKNEFGVEIVK